MKVLKIIAAAVAVLSVSLARAESEFTLYTGVQSSPDSTVHGVTSDFTAKWDGLSTTTPIYAGWRYTNWQDDEWGYAINYTHSKAAASSATLASAGYKVLEFTDGANPLTFIAMRRFEAISSGIRPYVGAGVGISFPHVEELRTTGTVETGGYQYGGPVVTALAGFSFPMNDKWSIIGEYQFHYLKLDTRVEGGRLKTNLINNAINIGVGYRF